MSRQTTCHNLGDSVPYRHKEQAQRIADDGLILRVATGSTVHGTALDDQSDRDEVGVCIEPRPYVIGLGNFQQYTFRTQPEGVPSGPGDLDLTVYSLRKYVRLILDGNPSILTLLYTPAEHVLFSTPPGQELMKIREWAISRLAAARFLGYMQAQAKRIDNNLRRDQETAEGDERFAYKPKMAGHYVRLAVQGVELLTTGELTLPMPEPHAEFVRELKRGNRTWAEAQEYAADYEQKLLALRESSTVLAPSPPWTQANRWLVDTYERYWGRYP